MGSPRFKGGWSQSQARGSRRPPFLSILEQGSECGFGDSGGTRRRGGAGGRGQSGTQKRPRRPPRAECGPAPIPACTAARPLPGPPPLGPGPLPPSLPAAGRRGRGGGSLQSWLSLTHWGTRWWRAAPNAAEPRRPEPEEGESRDERADSGELACRRQSPQVPP